MVLEEGNLIAERYKLLKQLGRGSFGEVWLAHNMLADIDVAIKFYGAFDLKGLEEFRSEFKLAYKLHHPNLLNISHFDVCDNCPYLVMPYCPNGSVSRQTGKMAEHDIWKFTSDVAAGLAFLHSQHPPIIHQDIKPDNILITADGRYVISDFGISRNLRTKMSSTSNISSSGTIAYMGPERFSETPVVVLASDIWAFGMTLYELMTGDVMWEGMGGCVQLNGARIPAFDQRFSPQLSRLVTACLAPQTWDRPTAEQVHSYAEAYLHHQALPSLPPNDTSPAAKPVDAQLEAVHPVSVKPIHMEHGSDRISRTESHARSSVIKAVPSDSLLPAGWTTKRLLIGMAALLVAILLITGVTMFFNSVREEQRFVSCQTLQDYQQFISDYPNSDYVETARKRIADLTATELEPVTAQEAPAEVKQPVVNRTVAPTAPVQQTHTTATPRSTQKQFRSISAADRADDAAYYSCVTSGDYHNYLTRFPNGRHREEATRALTDLVNRQGGNVIPTNQVNSRPSSSRRSSVHLHFSTPRPHPHPQHHR